MGASVSKNTAQAMADVSNSISNSTTASNTNISDQTNTINNSGCTIIAKGDININQTAKIAATNKQVASGMSDSDVKNNIQQKMMQEAMSTVGSMGIGYADASNSASMFASSTTDVVNTVKTEATQISNMSNHITCTDSVIRAQNINITQGLDANFLSDQVAKSDNITKIANTISQVAQQKATAKVAGLAGFILALAVLVLACGYSFAKAASAGGIVKILVMCTVLLLLGIVLVVMYLYKAPPLFNDPPVCSPNFSYGTGSDKCTDCVEQKQQELSLEHTPMKYVFTLTEKPRQDSGLTGSLLEMIVSAQTSPDDMKTNQGYTAANADTINGRVKDLYDGLPESIKTVMGTRPPDILIYKKEAMQSIPPEYRPAEGSCTPASIQIDPDADAPGNYSKCPTQVKSTTTTKEKTKAIASLNVDEWKDYLSKQPQFKRFFLLRLLESDKIKFDLTTYEDKDGNEPVVYMDGKDEKVALASEVKDKVAIYRNHSDPNPSAGGKSGSGTVKGVFGICNNQEYKLHKFGRRVGIWIVLALVLGLGIFLLVTYLRSKGPRK